MAGCAARARQAPRARLSLATFLLGASVLAAAAARAPSLQGRTELALYVAGLNALLLLLYRPPLQVQAGPGGPGRGWGPGGLGVANGHCTPRGRGPGRPTARPTRGGTSPAVFLSSCEFRLREGVLRQSWGAWGAGPLLPAEWVENCSWRGSAAAADERVGWGMSGPTSSFM